MFTALLIIWLCLQGRSGWVGPFLMEVCEGVERSDLIMDCVLRIYFGKEGLGGGLGEVIMEW